MFSQTYNKNTGMQNSIFDIGSLSLRQSNKTCKCILYKQPRYRQELAWDSSLAGEKLATKTYLT